tara:strand:+ start:77 stop:289 length:213 start_codon:yes stop_codon:yes gene_type:complete
MAWLFSILRLPKTTGARQIAARVISVRLMMTSVLRVGKLPGSPGGAHGGAAGFSCKNRRRVVRFIVEATM